MIINYRPEFKCLHLPILTEITLSATGTQERPFRPNSGCLLPFGLISTELTDGYGYEYINYMLLRVFVHKLVCPGHECRQLWVVGQCSALQKWVRENVIKLQLNFNDRYQAGKRDVLSPLIPWPLQPQSLFLIALWNLFRAPQSATPWPWRIVTAPMRL